MAVAAVVVLTVAAGATSLWIARAPAFEPATVEGMAYSLPEQPSIAVLPFADLTGNPDQAILVDGITDVIVTTLSRVPDLFVIDRGSVFSFKGKDVKIKDVAEELGVQYVLQGSVQSADERIRVNAQLNDALMDRTMWAENFDRDLDDVFALQDDITSKIMTELEVSVSQGEQARFRKRQTENIDAYLYFLEGVEHHHNLSAGEQTRAQELLGKAIELDPDFASAHAFLGYSYIKQARNMWVDDIEAARRTGEAHIRKAIEIDPDNVDALTLLGEVVVDAGEIDESIALMRRAAAAAPNNADVLTSLGMNLSLTGSPQEGLPLVERAMRISPNFPNWYLSAYGWSQFMLGNYDKAIASNLARHEIIPNSELPIAYLVIMYSAAGRMDEAREMVSKLRAIVPDYKASNFKTLAYGWFRPETFWKLIEHFETAGIENDLDD